MVPAYFLVADSPPALPPHFHLKFLLGYFLRSQIICEGNGWKNLVPNGSLLGERCQYPNDVAGVRFGLLCGVPRVESGIIGGDGIDHPEFRLVARESSEKDRISQTQAFEEEAPNATTARNQHYK